MRNLFTNFWLFLFMLKIVGLVKSHKIGNITLAKEIEGNTSSVSQKSEESLSYAFLQSEIRNNNNRNCQCGVRVSDPGKIVGGTVAAENDWPWMGALIYTEGIKPKQFCGSALINDRYLLTAAHCARDIPLRGYDKFKAFLGDNVIPDEPKDFLNIAHVKLHPRFNPGTLEYDLALIRLSKPLTFSNSINPVCLSQIGTRLEGKTATVTGWGWTLDNTTMGDNTLRQVDVEILPNSKCAKSYENIGIKITDTMLCAALPGKDSCKGDSGGPLIVKEDLMSDPGSSRYNLYGVVSFGSRCASSYPGVYTKVTKLMSWIKRNTRDAVRCIT